MVKRKRAETTEAQATAVITAKIPHQNTELAKLQLSPPLCFKQDWKPKAKNVTVGEVFCGFVEFCDDIEVFMDSDDDNCYLTKRMALFGINEYGFADISKIYGLGNCLTASKFNFTHEVNQFMGAIGYVLVDKELEEKIKVAKSKLTNDELELLGLKP